MMEVDGDTMERATPERAAASGAPPPVLEAILNLSHFHRDHEKFYAQEPRTQAVTIQRHARALQALADRWSIQQPAPQSSMSSFEGSVDLNDPAALQLDGVLFMEGEGEPAEVTRLKRDLRSLAGDEEATGRWLSDAMQASWEAANALLAFPALADQLGERHRIIANDWQAATMSILAARLLLRACDVLDTVDFAPTALRADLGGARHVPGYLCSAAELADQAADLLSDSAGLVHDNERRWRVFHQHVEALVSEIGGPVGAPDQGGTSPSAS
jgi:hypothetical protein